MVAALQRYLTDALSVDAAMVAPFSWCLPLSHGAHAPTAADGLRSYAREARAEVDGVRKRRAVGGDESARGGVGDDLSRAGGGSPMIDIRSRYSIDDLPLDERCEECGSSLVPVEQEYRYQGRGLLVRAVAAPALRCVGTCRGTWYPAEVTVDLLEQVIALLRKRGDGGAADQLRKTKRSLKEVAERQPVLRRRPLLAASRRGPAHR